MEEQNRPEYEHIDPDHLSGVSSGSSTSWESLGHIHEETLFFVLGMKFLDKGLEGSMYKGRVKEFCDQLILLFSSYSGEDNSDLAEDWSNGDQNVCFSYDEPPSTRRRQKINSLISRTLSTNLDFARQREYYILHDGVGNLRRLYKRVDERGKKNPQDVLNGNYAISLISHMSPSKDAVIKEGEIIPNDLQQAYQEIWEKAELLSLRESFGRSNFDQYIAKLFYFGYDLREKYDMELERPDPKAWRLAILATLLAQQATTRQEFYRMIKRKVGHLSQIADSIRDHYPEQMQRDLMASHNDIFDITRYTFNHRLIQLLPKFNYMTRLPENNMRVRDRRAKKYKKLFSKALIAAQNHELQSDVIDDIIEVEEDAADRFREVFRDKDESLDWMVLELAKYNPDYTLAFKYDELIKEDIFTYTDDQLEEYIFDEPFGLLKHCAIWLYIFNATTLLGFDQRFEKYAVPLDKHQNFGIGAEELLAETYEGVDLSDAFFLVESEALMNVLRYRSEVLEDVIATTNDMYPQFIDTYKEGYDFYIQTLDILVHKKKHDEIRYDFVTAYGDLLKQAKEERRGDDDDDDDFSEQR